MQQLLAQLSPTLESIAIHLSRDKSLQEDLEQEMRLHLCEQWQKTPNHTRSWYTQQCYYHALDYLKKGKSIDSKRRENVERLPLQHECPDAPLAFLPVPAHHDFEAELMHREFLRTLVRKLTEKQHKIVACFLQGYTEQEIGTMEGVSQQAIHQQWKSIQRIAWGILGNV
jgi:RNA polymerase sigma factor (sigma-70 family)